MKICIVGPGIMEIPPKGWGAVEILIHDYHCTLEKLGHQVIIVNTPHKGEIVNQVNTSKPDFVHLQYDNHIDVANYIQCSNIAMTSHFGYLEQPNRWGGYHNIFTRTINTPQVHIFCLSPGISAIYNRMGIPENRLHITPNGVREDLFKFEEASRFPDKSIYLAKIDYRKRQHLYQNIPNLYFAGRSIDSRFDTNKPCYLGEWDKDYLYENLTNYANLVLLSDGEAHPLVCMEAMAAGLGLVLSKVSTANLDLNLPFIDVIPDDRMDDIPYIQYIIEENRSKSITMRKQIREYVVEITALFDIKRETSGDGRSIAQYLEWFKETLQLKSNMTIYTEEKFYDFVTENRKNSDHETKIIIQKLEEIPFYKNNQQIKEIINDQFYRARIKDVSRVECNLSEYNVIQYSKFGWLKNAIQANPDYDYFFWMDAGCSRFFEGFDFKNEWPDTSTLDSTKILIQGNANFIQMFDKLKIEDYIWDNNCVLVGTLFGGGKSPVLDLHKKIDETYQYFVNNGCINNEQLALAIIAKQQPNMFDIRIHLDGTHLPLFGVLK